MQKGVPKTCTICNKYSVSDDSRPECIEFVGVYWKQESEEDYYNFNQAIENMESIKCYRGGARLLRYLSDNYIKQEGFYGDDPETLYFIEDRSIKAAFPVANPSNKVLIEKGLLEEIPVPKWRAREGFSYYFITSEGSITHKTDEFAQIDNSRYNLGNYFETFKDAKEAEKKIRSILA